MVCLGTPTTVENTAEFSTILGLVRVVLARQGLVPSTLSSTLERDS